MKRHENAKVIPLIPLKRAKVFRDPTDLGFDPDLDVYRLTISKDAPNILHTANECDAMLSDGRRVFVLCRSNAWEILEVKTYHSAKGYDAPEGLSNEERLIDQTTFTSYEEALTEAVGRLSRSGVTPIFYDPFGRYVRKVLTSYEAALSVVQEKRETGDDHAIEKRGVSNRLPSTLRRV